jgi:hypothetical protein
MEVATIVAGACLLYHIPFPFLMAPICFALMYLTMDTAPAVYMRRRFTMVEFAYVFVSQLLPASCSLPHRYNQIFWSAIMLAAARLLDMQRPVCGSLLPCWAHSMQELMLRDFAFWLYVFATPAFYCGITMLDARSHMDHVVYMVRILRVISGLADLVTR